MSVTLFIICNLLISILNLTKGIITDKETDPMFYVFAACFIVLNVALLLAHILFNLHLRATILLSGTTIFTFLGTPIGMMLILFAGAFALTRNIDGQKDVISKADVFMVFVYMLLFDALRILLYSPFDIYEQLIFCGVLIMLNYYGHKCRQKAIITEKKLAVETSKATHDKLTGLLTRVNLEPMLIAESKKIDGFAVIMMDIDNFKLVNDTFGHTVGDTVLQGLSNSIKNCIRKTDRAFRYGGEEFVVVCPGSRIDSAHKIAERIREFFSSTEYELEGGAKHFTVSLGVAECLYGEYTNMTELLNKADSALYASKHNGKNQVTDWNKDLANGSSE